MNTLLIISFAIILLLLYRIARGAYRASTGKRKDYLVIKKLYDVELREYSTQRRLAVLPFFGRATPERLAYRQKQLHNTIYKTQIKTRGKPFLIEQPKKIIPFLQKNELAVEI